MIKAACSHRTSAHSPLDNVTTPYNPIRLLKGAPPGQVSRKIRSNLILFFRKIYASRDKTSIYQTKFIFNISPIPQHQIFMKYVGKWFDSGHLR